MARDFQRIIMCAIKEPRLSRFRFYLVFGSRVLSTDFDICNVLRRKSDKVKAVSFFQMKNGQIIKKWHQFLEIQDGCGHHFEKYTSG